MSDDLPPLPASLRALIAAEDGVPAGGDRADVRGRVLATLGIAAAAAAAGTGAASTATAAAGTGAGTAVGAGATVASGIAGKLIVVAITAGAIGGGAAVMSRSRPAAHSAHVGRTAVAKIEPHSAHVGRTAAAKIEPSQAFATPAPVAPVRAAASVLVAPLPAVATAPVEPPPIAVPEPVAPIAIDDQPTLLRHAWDALAKGDPATVLELIDRDAKAHPDAALAEERDALRIEALLALHRADEARTRARAFAVRYPSTLHRELVDRALRETP